MSQERSADAPAGSTSGRREDDLVREHAEHAGLAEPHADETLAAAIRTPAPARHGWHGLGLSRRGERILDVLAVAVVLVFAAGWAWTIAHPAAAAAAVRPSTTLGGTAGTVAAALTKTDAPTAAYVSDAALEALVGLRGRSGNLRARILRPGETLATDTLSGDAHVVISPTGGSSDTTSAPPTRPGIYRLAVAVGRALRPVGDLTLISMVPFSAKQNGRIGQYLLGSWPAERGSGRVGPGKAPASKYANPRGFIEVTPQNQDTYVSEHFRLRDFLTHNQANVWPKYLPLQPELVDKLELVIDDLKARGIKVEHVTVMSGFRTPSYNATGGNTGGRANLSRHMYGDASDVFVDNDRDGWMDDLNGDGRRDIADSRVIAESVERVERAHPELVGGAGVYVPCCGHGPFIHIDVRGYRARWVGTGSG